VHFIVLTIIKLKNIFLDDKLKQTSEYISAKGTPEGLHNPKELREFQERVRRCLHRKFVQNCGQNRIVEEFESTCEEITKHDNLVDFGSRDLFISRGVDG
jgi:hypothetical protein